MESDIPHGPQQPPQHPPQPQRDAISRWLDEEPSPYDGFVVAFLLLLAVLVLMPQDWVRGLVSACLMFVAWIGSGIASRWIQVHVPAQLRWVPGMRSLRMLGSALVCEIPWLLWLGATHLVPPLSTSCAANCNIGTSLMMFMSSVGGLIAILGAALLPLELLWQLGRGSGGRR